jgi:hypothetical protein
MSDNTTMSDAELGAELCPDNPAEGATVVSRFTLEKRATYERLVAVGRELVLWEAGVGPMPSGVIVTPARGKWRR